MHKTIFAVLILAGLASGCTVKASGVSIISPGLEIGISGESGHCPPGQAKKGNC